MWSSPARYAVPILLALEVGVILIEDQQWTSEWRWAIDWAGAGVFLAGPLAGGLATWQAQAARRSPGEAAQVAGTPFRLFAFNAGGIFAWAALVHTVVIAGVVVACYRAGLTGVPEVAAIVMHWSLIAGCVSVGYTVGQFTSSRLAAPLSTVALVAFMIQASNGALPILWAEVAGATAPLTGLRYRPEVILGQLVLFWALVLVGLGVTKTARRSTYRFVVLGIASAAALSAAVALANAGEGRFVVRPSSALSQSCFGEAPEVCVLEDMKVHGPAIHAILQSVERAAGPSATLPTKYVQVLGSEGPSESARQFMVDAGMIQNNEVSAEMLIRYVAWNRKCLLADEAPPAEAVGLISDLAMVLLDRANQQDPADNRLLTAFNSLPRPVQDQWIADASKASNECAFDAIPEWLTQS